MAINACVGRKDSILAVIYLHIPRDKHDLYTISVIPKLKRRVCHHRQSFVKNVVYTQRCDVAAIIQSSDHTIG